MQFPCALFTETWRQRLPAGFCQCESKAKFSDFRGSCIFYLTSSSPLWRESKNTFSLVCRLRAVRVSQAIRGRKKKKKKGSNHLFFPLLVQSAGLLSCLSVFQKCILKFCIEWTCLIKGMWQLPCGIQTINPPGLHSSRDILLGNNCGTVEVHLVWETKLACQDETLSSTRLWQMDRNGSERECSIKLFQTWRKVTARAELAAGRHK